MCLLKQGIEVNKELNTHILVSSQKVANIEKGSQLGTHNKGMDTIQILPLKSKMFERKKKAKAAGAWGKNAHTVIQPLLSSVIEFLHTSKIDDSPINVEKQRHSLTIPFPTPQSNISSSIAMIENLAFQNSPSLQIREEPTLQTDKSPSKESSFLDHLNTDSPTIEKIRKSFTSIDNIKSTDITSSTDKSSSTDIPHPLIIPVFSTDIHKSMDISSPIEIIS